MNLSKLAELIEIATYGKPPHEIAARCGDYYEPYYHLFYLLASRLEPGSMAVELGVSKGRGLYSMAAGNPALTVIGLDLNIGPEIEMPPNVDFHLMSALPVPEFVDRVSLLHIDTEHSYGNALNEFMQYRCKLLPGAVVCFDDLHAMDNGVLRAFYELPYDKIQCDKLHPVNGYGVLIYE